MRFYTLLYIDLEESRKITGKKWEGEERILIFLKNACLLDASLMSSNPSNQHLTILTNNKRLLDELLDKINYHDITIEEISFNLKVPKGIPFYSAHFKIDVFKYLSQKENEYSILLDSDIVVLNKFSKVFILLIKEKIPIFYQMPYYTPDIILDTANKIDPQRGPVQWIGGEIIGGNNTFFSMLYEESIRIIPSYFNLIKEGLIHIGDEMITTLAIRRLKNKDLNYYDLGVCEIIKRYWGYQDKDKLNYNQVIFAHLLIDKVWIAKKFNKFIPFEKNKFIKCYKIYRKVYRHIYIFKKGVMKLKKIFKI